MSKDSLPIDERSIERTEAGGWRYSDSVYHARWLARVMSKVIVSEAGCWLWQGFKHPKGYAQTQYRGHAMNLHRAIYLVITGAKLTTEQFVCHTCDVRHCINPDHLWVGTAKDNNNDCAEKGRHHNGTKTHCPRGHAYTVENTYITPAGLRNCKECSRERNRQEWREHPAKMRARQKQSRLRKKQRLSQGASS